MPLSKTFPPELRTMAFVPRWGTVMTLRPDYVSSHSYFVAVYSGQIARLIEWKGDLGWLLTAALMHDVGEIVTGDLIGPTKAYILDRQRHQDYIDEKLEKLGINVGVVPDVPGWIYDIDRIVKVADRLDAVFFLIGEHRMGNSVANRRIKSAIDELWAAFQMLVPLMPKKEIGVDKTPFPRALWEDHFDQAIREHYVEGGWASAL